jgi:hypothetical protein
MSYLLLAEFPLGTVQVNARLQDRVSDLDEHKRMPAAGPESLPWLLRQLPVKDGDFEEDERSMGTRLTEVEVRMENVTGMPGLAF